MARFVEVSKASSQQRKRRMVKIWNMRPRRTERGSSIKWANVRFISMGTDGVKAVSCIYERFIRLGNEMHVDAAWATEYSISGT